MQDSYKNIGGGVEPRNQYKRASNPTTTLSVPSTAADRYNASPAKSGTGKKAQQRELCDRLNAPIVRKQRGSAVSQGGLR